MNRKSFLKSLVTLIAAPSILKDISPAKTGLEHIGYTQTVKPFRIRKQWTVEADITKTWK